MTFTDIKDPTKIFDKRMEMEIVKKGFKLQ